MSHYKPYPAYKDSGVEWIGKVPEHWRISKLKYEYECRLGKMIQPTANSINDEWVPYHRAQTVQWERIDNAAVEPMWASPSDIKKFSISVGDLLVCEGGDVCRSAIVREVQFSKLIFQNSIHRVQSKGEYVVDWVLRLMQHLRSSGWIDVLCNKNTIVHFTSEKLANLSYSLPPQREQYAIIAALDRETSRIDALIAKKTEFIELLTKKHQVLITHAVTKGLNPKAKMKDSGVEWIGEVPAHWDVVQSRRLFSERKERARDGDVQLTASQKYGVIPQSEFIEREGRRVMLVSKGYDILKHIESGDFLISMRSFEGGLEECKSSGCVSSAYVPLAPIKWVWNPFFRYLFKSTVYIQALQCTSDLVRDGQALRFENFSEVPLLHIDIDEQRQIAEFLDRQLGRIDGLITKTRLSIDLLKKRRSALITAAVTGQIDLREFA